MNSTLQCLVQNMLTLAIAPSPDQKGLFIAEEEDGALRESLVTAGEPGVWEEITDDAKPGTPAKYLVMMNEGQEYERRILYLNESNELACSRYNNEIHEWEDCELEGLSSPPVAHPETRISGFCHPEGSTIVFQNPSQHLEVLTRNGAWVCAGVIRTAADPPAGTLHVAIDSPERLNIFYMRQDNQIGHLTQQYATGLWNETVVKNSKFEAPVTHMLVVPVDQQGCCHIYVAVDSRLVHIDADGQRQELGTIDGGEFIPSTKEECAPVVMWALSLGTFLIGFSFGAQHQRGQGPSQDTQIPHVGGQY